MKVVDYGNLPARFPIWSSLTLWLFLDRLAAPGWVYGVCGTIMFIIWAVAIFKFVTQTEIKIWEK